MKIAHGALLLSVVLVSILLESCGRDGASQPSTSATSNPTLPTGMVPGAPPTGTDTPNSRSIGVEGGSVGNLPLGLIEFPPDSFKLPTTVTVQTTVAPSDDSELIDALALIHARAGSTATEIVTGANQPLREAALTLTIPASIRGGNESASTFVIVGLTSTASDDEGPDAVYDTIPATADLAAGTMRATVPLGFSQQAKRREAVWTLRGI